MVHWLSDKHDEAKNGLHQAQSKRFRVHERLLAPNPLLRGHSTHDRAAARVTKSPHACFQAWSKAVLVCLTDSKHPHELQGIEPPAAGLQGQQLTAVFLGSREGIGTGLPIAFGAAAILLSWGPRGAPQWSETNQFWGSCNPSLPSGTSVPSGTSFP